jgi:uncharacterized membrane protein
MRDVKEFFIKYRGAIIGGLVALIALLLNFHKVLIFILIIVAGILIGNYVQHNKEFVKEKLKSYIDKL